MQYIYIFNFFSTVYPIRSVAICHNTRSTLLQQGTQRWSSDNTLRSPLISKNCLLSGENQRRVLSCYQTQEINISNNSNSWVFPGMEPKTVAFADRCLCLCVNIALGLLLICMFISSLYLYSCPPGGAAIDGRDRCSRTALHAAAWRGRSAALKALLQNGASPSAVCTQGATPLGIRIYNPKKYAQSFQFKII